MIIDCFDQEFSIYDTYIKLEKLVNSQIKQKTNCAFIIQLIQEQIDRHLDQVLEMRQHMNDLPIVSVLPNKNDFGFAAQKVINNESKIDELDQQVYNLMKLAENRKHKLEDLKKRLKSIKLVNDDQFRPSNKMNLLIRELQETKSLFRE